MGLVDLKLGGDIMEYSPKKMQNNLNSYNFHFKKNFGQNFIVDENVINSIIEKSNIDKNTLVIEIGPGAGSLTSKLSKYAKNVLCYEIDNTLEEVLCTNLDGDNVDIIFGDFLKCDVISDIKNYNYDKLYIIANLPYYITTPIIMKIIEDKLPVSKIVIMVQKEVGDRFKASPGSKDYNSLSIFLQYHFQIKKLLDVSRNVFLPKPNVDSIVVEFKKIDKKYVVNDEDLLFRLIKDSFTQKRKTLRNNLKKYDLNIIANVLEKYNLDLSVRAEQLSLEQFIDIANALSN